MKKRTKRQHVLLFLVPFAVIMSSLVLEQTGANFYSEDQKNYQTKRGDLKVHLVDTGTVPAMISVNQPQARQVAVKNEGTVSQFLRVMVLPEVTTTGGVLAKGHPSELLKGLNTTVWREGKDGYYYYLKKLTGRQETAPLFTQIVSPTVGTLTLHVKVEAITAEGTSFEEAWWNGTVPTTPAELAVIDRLLKNEAE